MISTAKEFEELGLFPVPCNVQKDSCDVWAKWENEPRSVDGWADLFQKQNGIGIKLGEASGDLIVIDIDQKHDSTATISNRFIEAIKYLLPNSWDSFYIEETRSGGLHLFLRVNDLSTDKYVPAYTMDLNKNGELKRFPLIEILSEGQMVFTHPTPNYRIAQGAIDEIPTISKDDWNELLGICRSFNEVPTEEARIDSATDRFEALDPNDQRPGTIFNKRVEPTMVVKFLTQHGWSVHKRAGDVFFLTRPGKDRGVSATFNFDGRKLLCVFSSSTEFETHRDNELRGYTPFSIVAQLKFGGDYKATTGYLVEKGYVNPDEWDEVEPLEMRKADPFNLDELLPDGCQYFKRFVSEISEAYQVEPEMIVLPCLSIVSLCLSGAVRVELKEDWKEDAPLWSIVVGEASERKSVVLNEIMDPVEKFFGDFRKKHKKDLSMFTRRRRAIESKLEKLENDYDKAIGKGGDGESLLGSIRLTEIELDEMPDIVEMPNLLQSDITAEALVKQLERNGEVCGIISAEADPIEVALGLYSDKPNFSIHLKGYSVERYTSNRVGGGETVIEKPRVVLSVLMQSEPMQKLSESRQAMKRGFVARCLFAVPTSRVGSRKLEPDVISKDMREWWALRLGSMLSMPHRKRFLESGSKVVFFNEEPRVVKISREAHEVFLKARIENEKGLASGGEYDDESGWGGKLMGNVGRLALALHFLSGETERDEISGDVMESACRWVDPLTDHYYCAMGRVGEINMDKRVHGSIKSLSGKIDGVMKLNDIFKILRTKRYGKMDDWTPVFSRMVDLGFVRIKDGEKPKRGPIPKLIEFHPNFENLAGK